MTKSLLVQFSFELSSLFLFGCLLCFRLYDKLASRAAYPAPSVPVLQPARSSLFA